MEGYSLEPPMKKLLAAVVAAVVLLLAVVLGRTVASTSLQPQVEPVAVEVDVDAAAAHLAEAIRIPTVSNPEQHDPERFKAFNAWLTLAYPQVHASLQREVINDLSLLYTWTGADPSLPPVLLVAHSDVVPVEPGTEAGWTHPPYAGVVADGAVWGRGSVDDKAAVIAIMEAVDALIAQGFAPRRTVLIAVGHDEEIGGTQGAARVAEHLAAQGVHAAWALDEGMVITMGIIPGLAGPGALIGISERGSITVEISAEDEGGHSSMPPEHTAVGRVARAIARMEADPFPAALDGPAAQTFDWLGPEMPFGNKLAFANRWLLGGVITGQLTKKTTTNATVRTTQAATMFAGGPKENVLPQRAWARVNLRLHPRDSSASAIERVRTVIDDPEVTVALYTGTINSEPSPVSSTDGPGFLTLTRTIREVVPEAVVAPGLVVGATDARHYTAVADDVYRFNPLRFTAETREQLHGTDEHMPLENLEEYVAFFMQLMRNA
ncbi:MAG: M20 family peptidase [Alphaproteobacteria bacterium]|nr:M20 family peptidase [Alphaproteobacteria bacterium]